MKKLIFKEEVYAIIGASMEVYNEMGNGFLEAVYQEALGLELTERAIPFQQQKLLPIFYKKYRLRKEYKADFVVFDKIIVEIKAEKKLTTNDEAQLLNYLHATKFQLGVLINFGAEDNLEWKRMILTK